MCVREGTAHSAPQEKRDSGVAHFGPAVRRKAFPVRSQSTFEQGQYLLTVFICLDNCAGDNIEKNEMG